MYALRRRGHRTWAYSCRTAESVYRAGGHELNVVDGDVARVRRPPRAAPGDGPAQAGDLGGIGLVVRLTSDEVGPVDLHRLGHGHQVERLARVSAASIVL